MKVICPNCASELTFEEPVLGMKRFCSVCGSEIIVKAMMAESSTGYTHPNNPEGLLESSARQAREIFKDLQDIPLKQEIIPIDQSNLQILMKDFVFWAVSFLGIIPLLIITVREPTTQLTMFALFFAFVWGVIFKKFIVNDTQTQRLAIPSLFFTGIIGIWSLLFIYRFLLPNFYLNLADSPNIIVSLIGYIFQVGVCEELIKALPIVIAIRYFKKDISSLSIITIGVFSGLGFAAFENLQYGNNAINSAYAKTIHYGVEGLVSGVQNAMVNVMLRSLSLVFCHAVFSGIVAYFITTAYIRREKMGALILLGVMVASILHGLYDWLAGIQPTLAAVLAGFSFALFYGYLSKLKNSDRKLSFN